MGGMKVSDLDFLRLLPAFMRDDEAAIALSKAMNQLIGGPGKRLHSIKTWDQVEDLTGAECDELAWELDIDWYDSTGMSLEDKRATIQLAQQIKRKRGTKWAVERLISAYFGEGYIMEWYEMDDTPFTFVALTTNTHVTAENFGKFVEAVKAAKNERSHLAGVFYFWQQGPDPGIEYALGSSLHRYNFRKCGTYPRTATIGFVVKPSIETEPEAKLHLYGFTHAGDLTCGTYPRPGTLGAIVKGQVVAKGTPDAIRYEYDRKAGTYPRPGTLGAALSHAARARPAANLIPYEYTDAGTLICGTYPRPGTLGATVKNQIGATTDADFITYGLTKAKTCGTYPRPGALGAVTKKQIGATASTDLINYDFTKTCGTYPRPGTQGAAGKIMATTAPAIVYAAYSFVQCGTRRCGE